MIRPNINPPLGPRLRAYRAARGLTALQLADELGFPYRSYVDIESGRSESSEFVRRQLGKMLADFERQNTP